MLSHSASDSRESLFSLFLSPALHRKQACSCLAGDLAAMAWDNKWHLHERLQGPPLSCLLAPGLGPCILWQACCLLISTPVPWEPWPGTDPNALKLLLRLCLPDTDHPCSG